MSVLIGTWGARAGELLERADGPLDASIDRTGPLTMPSPPQLVAGSWCCWLFGEPEGREELARRFDLGPGRDLALAFGQALTELGEAAFELLCGRFVVVALDRDRGHCLVARDQLGAQPLVYAGAADGIIFAEHERDLLDLLRYTPGPDRLALLQWIDNGVTLRERTLYEGMRRLSPGHLLRLDGTGVRIERWWNLRYQGTDTGTEEVVAGRLREAVFAAVGRATVGSNRPVVKLSGGLDSAGVAAGLVANGFADGRALALAGTFSTHPETDESELIEATARHTHLALERIAFDTSSSILAPALEHIVNWRLPPATPNLFLWQPLMARARELGADVMLDGEGGDELFGFAPHLIADMLRTGRWRTAWSLTGRIHNVGRHLDRRVRMRILRNGGIRPLVPDTIKRHRARRRGNAYSGAIVPRSDALALLELNTATREPCEGPLWWRSQLEDVIDSRDLLGVASHYRREAAEERIDRRHPFLHDLTLIEAALRLPPLMQFDPVRDRPLLREALTGWIPEAVRTRHEKSHFTPLVLAGVQADEPGLIDPLRRCDAPVRAYVAPDALARKLGVAPGERSMLGALAMWRIAIANRWLLHLAEEGA